MASILHLRKELECPPVALSAAGVRIRSFNALEDVAAWLSLRDRATADLSPPVRRWSEDDFRIEMLGKPWWRGDRTWLAIDSNSTIVGAVTLAERKGSKKTVPIVHWLMVDPGWRRRGIGRLLVSHLEEAAWDAGWREVQLETHAGWADAVAFYQSIGYAPVRERSPR